MSCWYPRSSWSARTYWFYLWTRQCGLKGEKGIQGSVGAKGDHGERGEHGVKGEKGNQGDNSDVLSVLADHLLIQLATW